VTRDPFDGKVDYRGSDMIIVVDVSIILRGRKGQFATSDIVEFVHVHQFNDNYEQFTVEVLAEILNRLHEFCTSIEFRLRV
jgi:hypothetical protein